VRTWQLFPPFIITNRGSHRASPGKTVGILEFPQKKFKLALSAASLDIARTDRYFPFFLPAPIFFPKEQYIG
jgi:hypothetical protein